MKFFYIILMYSIMSADSSCVVCHNEIKNTPDTNLTLGGIHLNSKMMGSIQELALRNNETVCVSCHGGNSSVFDIDKAHKKSSKNHFLKLNRFVKNPELDEVASQKICAQCHDMGSL